MTSDQARVLLIENDEDFARKTKEMLEKRGHRAVVATESPLALRLFLRHPSKFDAVVVDEDMPRAMGTSLTEGILRLRPGIPMIILSDAARTGTPVYGFFVAMSKRSEPEELASAICRLLTKNTRLPLPGIGEIS